MRKPKDSAKVYMFLLCSNSKRDTDVGTKKGYVSLFLLSSNSKRDTDKSCIQGIKGYVQGKGHYLVKAYPLFCEGCLYFFSLEKKIKGYPYKEGTQYFIFSCA